MHQFRTPALIVLAVFSLTAIVLAAGEVKPPTAGSSTELAAPKITWLNYDEGLALAKKQGKHVFVNFTTSWCGYCKKMDATTFADSEVVKMIGDRFVAVKVDGDSKHELDINGYKITESSLTKEQYGVSGYPTYWFLTPEAKKLGALRGYQFKDQLMQALTYVAEKKYDTTKTDQKGQKGQNK